jgi:hypothetical protein
MTALATQDVSATELTAQVTAAQIAAAGIAPITVTTPSPGGGTSNAMQFEVDTAGSTQAIFASASATVTAGSSATFSVTLPSGATDVSLNCLNLPPGAACSYSSAASTVTITTASSTPKGTYQITMVFSETLPGVAPALIVFPILLLPILFARRRMAKGGVWLVVCLAIALAAASSMASGCGGGVGSSSSPPISNPTYQATSSGVVSLTVQ